MKSSTPIVAAKVIAIIGFAILVICTYGLRSEVLELNRIRFSAEEEGAAHELERHRDSHPERVAAYELELRQHELRVAHYEREMAHYAMLVELAETDIAAFTRLVDEGGLEFPSLPRIPRMPSAPEPPGMRDRLAEIRADFAAQRYHYFDMTTRMNWVACAGALMLVGGLLYLLMFDIAGARLFYLIVLILSFVFMIGPSFHTILSGIVGFLEMPG